MKMYKTMLGVALAAALRCGSAASADPVQLVVWASEGKKCSATLLSGSPTEHTNLTTAFPDALVVYKGPVAIDGSDLLYQSCEIDVPRAQFLEKFSSCAVAMADKGHDCYVSFAFAGGRYVEFSASNAEGHKPAEPAVCSFVCNPATQGK